MSHPQSSQGSYLQKRAAYNDVLASTLAGRDTLGAVGGSVDALTWVQAFTVSMVSIVSSFSFIFSYSPLEQDHLADLGQDVDIDPEDDPRVKDLYADVKDRLIPFATSQWIMLAPGLCRTMERTIGALLPGQTLGDYFLEPQGPAQDSDPSASASSPSASWSVSSPSASASALPLPAPPAPATHAPAPLILAPTTPTQPAPAPLVQGSPSPILAPSRRLSPSVARSDSRAHSPDSPSFRPSPLEPRPTRGRADRPTAPL
jgi:hypothetical protein